MQKFRSPLDCYSFVILSLRFILYALLFFVFCTNSKCEHAFVLCDYYVIIIDMHIVSISMLPADILPEHSLTALLAKRL